MAIGAAIVGAVAQGISANRAAKSQRAAAQADINYQRETRDMIMGLNRPFYNSGRNAQNALAYEYGLRGRPQGYDGFRQTQDYRFGMDQGQKAVQASAAARGGLYSGAAMRDLNQWSQDYASTRRGNYLAGLSGLAGMGLSAANMNSNAAQNSANSIGNSLAAMGNASAAGNIGMGNAITGGINNMLGIWQYQRAMQPNNQSFGINIGAPGSLFGGSSWS